MTTGFLGKIDKNTSMILIQHNFLENVMRGCQANMNGFEFSTLKTA